VKGRGSGLQYLFEENGLTVSAEKIKRKILADIPVFTGLSGFRKCYAKHYIIFIT